MLDRTIVSFDIETIPDPECGRQLHGLSGTDAEVVRALMKVREEETEGATSYPAHVWHRVVCICATVLDVAAGTVTMRPLGGDLLDEASHLEGFFRLVCDDLREPRLVSWNGSGYDLPIIRYRSMAHGVRARDFYRQTGDRKYNHYLGRFHDLHVDAMDVLCNYGGAQRAGLDATSRMLGLPGKSFLTKSIVDHVLQGEHDPLVEYCKLDTLSTLLVFLTWGHHAGWVEPGQMRDIMRAVRSEVGGQVSAEWAEVGDAIARWPKWFEEAE